MKTIPLLFAVILACGCATRPTHDRPGGSVSPETNTTAALGPYRVRYEADGAAGSLKLTKDDELLYVKTGNSITVYAGNQPIFDYVFTPAGTLTAAFMVHIRAADGTVAFTLMDENADGVFDRKIDYGTKAVYRWKDNQWVN